MKHWLIAHLTTLIRVAGGFMFSLLYFHVFTKQGLYVAGPRYFAHDCSKRITEWVCNLEEQ